ncbi:MAG: endolytic transglycosylase MltG [Dehalococcoidia bacterium]
MTQYRTAWAAVIIMLIVVIASGAWLISRTPGAIFDEDDVPRVDAIESGGDPLLFTVNEGDSAAAIGDELEAQGIVRSALLFEVLVALNGVGSDLEAGEYELDRGMTAIEVVHRIAEGKTASRVLTVPEGLRIEEIGELLEVNGITTKDAFLAALVKSEYSEPFLQQIATDDLQGYVFPAGYEFGRSTTAEQVAATMLRGFQTNVFDEVSREGQAMTFHDVVTLASIVEREAATAEERPIIASVFLNRLRLGIPLQADPTVQFAVAADPASVEQYGYWKRELTLDDLKIDSPYNTYVYGGLPPGPIANPGLDSVLAVIRPASTEYLFFVAKADDGTHVFAETLEEHEANVQMYQR